MEHKLLIIKTLPQVCIKIGNNRTRWSKERRVCPFLQVREEKHFRQNVIVGNLRSEIFIQIQRTHKRIVLIDFWKLEYHFIVQ